MLDLKRNFHTSASPQYRYCEGGATLVELLVGLTLAAIVSYLSLPLINTTYEILNYTLMQQDIEEIRADLVRRVDCRTTYFEANGVGSPPPVAGSFVELRSANGTPISVVNTNASSPFFRSQQIYGQWYAQTFAEAQGLRISIAKEAAVGSSFAKHPIFRAINLDFQDSSINPIFSTSSAGSLCVRSLDRARSIADILVPATEINSIAAPATLLTSGEYHLDTRPSYNATQYHYAFPFYNAKMCSIACKRRDYLAGTFSWANYPWVTSTNTGGAISWTYNRVPIEQQVIACQCYK
jgi:hypothetical protein